MPHFNYTNRKRIHRADVPIELVKVGKAVEPRVTLHLDSYGFPPDAPIWIELYTSAHVKRLGFGTVANRGFKGPKMIQGELDASELKVRVKVLDPNPESSKIIGIMKGCKPGYQEEDGELRNESLLDLRSKPLNGEIWWVDFQQEREDHPVLYIEESLGDYRSLATAAWFQALIMPQVMKEILINIIIHNEFSEEDDDSVWGNWLLFAQQFAPDSKEIPVVDQKSDSRASDVQSAILWIEQAVGSFARAQKFREDFSAHVKGNQE